MLHKTTHLLGDSDASENNFTAGGRTLVCLTLSRRLARGGERKHARGDSNLSVEPLNIQLST